MKPLSIEELKELKENDYFWLVNINDANKNIYISNISYTKETLSGLDFYNYSRRMKWDNYGKTWLAYKNKEQAECQGELVEFPRIIHPNELEWFVQYQYPSGIIDYEIFYSLEKAEQKLKELRNING